MRQFIGGLGYFIGLGFETEVIYSFVIIVCSLMIYYATKELYKLSSYKGIKYFRQAFLFFALAYFFRFIIKFILVSFNIRAILDFSPRVFGMVLGQITLFIFMYFSSIAIFYLLYSVMWKKWNNKPGKGYLFHTLAFIIAIISSLFRGSLIYLVLNVFLLLFVLSVVYIAYRQPKNKKKKHNLYIVYLLLFIFWILNIVDILIPNFFQNIQLLIYLASSGIFLMILYKVLKKTGG